MTYYKRYANYKRYDVLQKICRITKDMTYYKRYDVLQKI